MPVIQQKPTSNARRQMSIADFSGLTKKRPEKRLSKGKQRISGRNNMGRVTVRHRGGGHKKLLRQIDFKQTDKQGITGRIAAIEYDPNRSAYIALIHYADGEKRYILAAEGLKVDDEVVCGERTKVKSGNRMKLEHVPVGYRIFNIELQTGRGGKIVRSAGASAVLVGFDAPFAIIQLPSGEMRKVRNECYASIGSVSNPDHHLITIGKAGRNRWKGKKPEVLGKSMNAVDHPHGGGEGHSPIGLKYPKTPWGKHALGVKTRRPNRPNNALIVRRRTKKKSKR
ncbi:MAG: 50S ribosomal protein L2 [Candidatus Peribacteraceae bacterium]|nr:50S ribosomal protein L2 [Candidatus Peribacteraceae bacterium]MBP9850719.1 50S ribosomal protein L2 [Candidatus Peribacteraceae bacterium]